MEEYTKIERETESSWMQRVQRGDSMLICKLIREKGLFCTFFPVCFGELRQITIIVAFPLTLIRCMMKPMLSHFRIKHLFLVIASSGGWNETLVQQLDNILTNISQFSFDFLSLATYKIDAFI